ncbi:hypothetical protein AC1031_015364 [Aphanomyces cochlioides]|nr:hypothetical protein AC1031_015364 [Aphanomyces cochlioides]
MQKTSSGRAKWDTEKDAYLIKLLIRQKDAGKQSDSGFKKEAWMAILTKFNNRFACSWDKEKLKTRYNQLKSDWKLFTSLKNDSVFGWDPDEMKPTAPESVWAERIAAKPKPIQAKLKNMQLNGLEHQSGLAYIFEGSMATGILASGVGGSCVGDEQEHSTYQMPLESASDDNSSMDMGNDISSADETPKNGRRWTFHLSVNVDRPDLQ